MNSIIKLTKPSQKLFFKAINVTLYPQFDHYFHSIASCEPNPYVSLLQECSYVKNTQVIIHTHMLDTFNALLELSSEEESCNSCSMSSLLKYHHRALTTQSNPTLSLDFQSRQAYLLESGMYWLILNYMLLTTIVFQMKLFLFITMIALPACSLLRC